MTKKQIAAAEALVARADTNKVGLRIAAETLLKALEAARADSARLDWLDEVNQSINTQHGTVYGWRFDVNHNRAQVRLDDCNIPALSVREAIDKARKARHEHAHRD